MIENLLSDSVITKVEHRQECALLCVLLSLVTGQEKRAQALSGEVQVGHQGDFLHRKGCQRIGTDFPERWSHHPGKCLRKDWIWHLVSWST